MLDHALIASVAAQMSDEKSVTVEGKSFPITRTSTQRLRTVRFDAGGQTYQAIEQNPEKPSRWGQLAREGHWVVQFRDVATGKYIAVSVDGKVQEFGRSK